MANANALQKPLTPSAELAAVIGPGPHTRAEATSKLWSYIKENGCQNPQNRREIMADSKLQAVFGGAATATMFEVPGHINRHLA
jgi:chromatin remodeling complex protein RSC6